jgi:hypothetical protein
MRAEKLFPTTTMEAANDLRSRGYDSPADVLEDLVDDGVVSLDADGKWTQEATRKGGCNSTHKGTIRLSERLSIRPAVFLKKMPNRCFSMAAAGSLANACAGSHAGAVMLVIEGVKRRQALVRGGENDRKRFGTVSREETGAEKVSAPGMPPKASRISKKMGHPRLKQSPVAR